MEAVPETPAPVITHACISLLCFPAIKEEDDEDKGGEEDKEGNDEQC